MSLVTSRDDGGFEEVAAHALAAGSDLAALGNGVGDVFLDLLDGRRVDQRAGGDAFSAPLPTFSFFTAAASFSAKAS
jgi:hypothetical protein